MRLNVFSYIDKGAKKMRLKNLLYLSMLALIVFTGVSSLGQPVPPPSLSGVWDFKLRVTKAVGTDGFVKKESHSYEWVIRLKQEGSKLTGDLIGARGSRGEH